MKKHIISAILTLAMLISITGCSSDTSSIVSDTAQTTASTSQSETTEPTTSTTSHSETTEQTTSTTPAVTNDEKSGFDFDEAVKNITLFGKQISLPCTWEDMGSDFSPDEFPVPVGDTGNLICGLLYKGKKVGHIEMKDCKIGDDLTDKKIITLSVGLTGYTYPYNNTSKENMDFFGYYSEFLELEFAGLTFNSTEEDVINVLGQPTNRYDYLGSFELEYEYKNGYLDFQYERDKLNTFMIIIET